MAATGRPIEQYDPNPELGQEKKDETLKELLMLLQASFHDVRNDFTALSQRVLQHVYGVNEIDPCEVRETMEQLRKLDHKINTLSDNMSACAMKNGTDPTNKVNGH